MNTENSTQMRLRLQRLMHKKNISFDTWLPIYRHIAKLETTQGDKMVKEFLSMIESGATEIEIKETAKVKHKIQMME